MATLPSFDNTLGALFIGFSVSAVIYGMLFVQAYIYYHRYPSDKVGYRAIVTFLLLLETVHQALIGHSVYYYSITNFMNLPALLEGPVWSLSLQLLVGAIVGSIVKFFFSLRVWRFSKGNIWLTAFLLLLNFAQLGLAVDFTVKCYALSSLSDLETLRLPGTIALGIGVLDDLGIAVSLCYYLQTMRSSYRQTNSLVRTLTIYAVSTGLLTSALSFFTVIIYNAMPKNFVFVGCYLVLSKLYGSSFVATLNTRQTIRGRGTDCDAKRFSLATDQRVRSLNLPLHPTIITRDPPGTVSRGGNENGATVRDSGEDPMTPNRPDYPVGSKALENEHIAV